VKGTTIAAELWTELWNKTTLHLPLILNPTDDKIPSRVTTLQNKVTALTTIYADTKVDYKEHAKHGTTTVNAITNIKNRLKEKQVLKVQLKEKQQSLDELLDKAATAKLAVKAAQVSVKEKKTELSLARNAEKCRSILLTAHREGGRTFTKAMKVRYKYKDWVHPTNKDKRFVGKQTEAILYVL
jgi:flagellar capping protein FliD